ncbi:hypothetical protein BVG16_27245 [Paenibacillus selenitireducens]|uniref:Glycerophosphoryl diester phosphodiesterase membrane domain-containing protein n=1 Tax=Paenibacillus selenitireducens TaxID=1324314 RepID=A0A1T2X1L9_9BACL|nr:hypothetical protein [Paenibacillus selenitireducens]OPA73781.1 hypothetical protein BVG16_27245 [Paenibacillus selenitireducens]
MNNFELENELQGMNLLRKAWGLYIKNIMKIICIVMIVALPVEAIKNFLLIDIDIGTITSRTVMITFILNLLLSIVPSVIICFMFPQMMKERTISVKESFQQGVKFWPKVIGFGIIVKFLVIIGMICFIVPGLVYTTRFLFVNYIIILEGTYGNNPISRSNQMVKGRTWEFFMILVSIGLIQWGISYFLGYVIDSWVIGTVTDVITDIMLEFTTVLFLVAYLILRRYENPEQVIEIDGQT